MCGDSGSAGNTNYLADDFPKAGSGVRATTLPASPAVIMAPRLRRRVWPFFLMQLAVQAEPGDVLIMFSGSGNSPNILRALECAREMRLR